MAGNKSLDSGRLAHLKKSPVIEMVPNLSSVFRIFLKFFLQKFFLFWHNTIYLLLENVNKTKHRNGRERITFRSGKCMYKIEKYWWLTIILNDLVRMTLISNLIWSWILFFGAYPWIEFYLEYSSENWETEKSSKRASFMWCPAAQPLKNSKLVGSELKDFMVWWIGGTDVGPAKLLVETK